MIQEILRRHREGVLDGGVPNPSLETICQLVSKAAESITPNVQRSSFRNTGLTLPIDGSADHQLSPDFKTLLDNHGQDLSARPADIARFSNPQPTETKSAIAQAFEILCADAQKAKQEEFSRFLVISSKKKKREERKGKLNILYVCIFYVCDTNEIYSYL